MTDINYGLTDKEVCELTARGLNNISVGNQSKSIGQIIIGNVLTYYNLIFAIFAALLIMVKSYMNMTFLPVIIANTLIGIVQEIRAKIVLDRLIVVNSPKTCVIREGKECIVDSEKLVTGDICIFKSGNQLSADAVLVKGQVRVNEALVTGEADEVIKNAGDILLSGSFIVSGECRACLTNVGHNSFASKLALEAKATRNTQKKGMMQSLDRLVKLIGIIIIPIGAALFIQSRFFLKYSVKSSVNSMVASLVGMIPEGLYLLASVALVVSVMRLAKQSVLVHEMNCVETLARVNVLCVDKTGTITEPEMSVDKVKYCDGVNVSSDAILRLMAKTTYNLSSDNETMNALKAFLANEIGAGILEGQERADCIYPFSSRNKYSGARFGDTTLLFGAPEYVLGEEYGHYEQLIRSFGKSRVIVFGETDEEPDNNPLGKSVKPLAFVSLINEIRENAVKTFEYFKEQGVDIKVISGDNPITASEIAKKAGIDNAKDYVDATFLETDEDILNAVNTYSVFGRVVPEQKKKIIKALKKSGKVVAMCGDGVNDVLALKEADCSVAFASGSEAACNAAQLVLLDSDFAKMPKVVLEGRRVVNNIQRSASLFLVKNLFSIMLTIFTLGAANLYPLYPTQLSLLGIFTIGGPAFFLALQPNKSIIKGDFLTNVILKALPASITDFVVIMIIAIYGNLYGVSHEQTATMATCILVTVGITALINICRPFDKIRFAVCVSMIIGLVMSFLFLKPIFYLVVLPKKQLILTVILMLCSVPAFVFFLGVVEGLISFLSKRSRRFKKLIG